MEELMEWEGLHEDSDCSDSVKKLPTGFERKWSNTQNKHYYKGPGNKKQWHFPIEEYRAERKAKAAKVDKIKNKYRSSTVNQDNESGNDSGEDDSGPVRTGRNAPNPPSGSPGNNSMSNTYNDDNDASPMPRDGPAPPRLSTPRGPPPPGPPQQTP